MAGAHSPERVSARDGGERIQAEPDDRAIRAGDELGAPDPTTDEPGDEFDVLADEDPVPLWYQRGLVVVVAATLAFGGFGLLLAFFGNFRNSIVFPVGAVLTAVIVALAWPRRAGAPPSTRAVHLPALAMCVVALGLFAWNGVENGHYVEIDRDPGVYAATAKWLNSEHSLEVQGGKTWALKGTEFRWTSAGMYAEGNGRLEFQFSHFAPVLFAEAAAVGGDQALFAMPALISALGLCAIYAVGCRVVRKPWLVLAAVTSLGLGLPQISISRDTYSEGSAQLLLWSGLFLVLLAWERRKIGIALIAGLALGGTLMSRIDAFVYIVPLPLLAAIALTAATSGKDRRSLIAVFSAIFLGALPAVALSYFDLKYRSTGYYEALHGQVTQLRLAFVVSAIGGLLLLVFWPRWAAIRDWAGRRQVPIATTAGGVVLIGLVLAWTLRPALQHPTAASNSNTAIHQQLENLPVNAVLGYDERTMIWMAWYIGGIALTLAIIGAAALIYRCIVRPDSATLLLVAAAGTGCALYLWTPQITPTQIWAMRRYVPAALPFLILCAAIAVDAGMRVLPRLGWRPAWARLAPIAAVVAIVAFPLSVTAPVRNYQSQAGFLSVVNKTCQTLGTNAAAIFVVGDRIALTLPQTMRSYCNVPASALNRAMTADELRSTAARFQAEGRVLWVLGSTAQLITKSAPGLDPTLVAATLNRHALEETVSRAPQAYATEQLTIFAARVDT